MIEKGNAEEAEKELRAALNLDSRLAPAAYNLGLLIIKDRPEEGLSYCKIAHDLSPDDPKYGYTLAFFQAQRGDRKGAVVTLKDTLRRSPGHMDAVLLLGEIYTQGEKRKTR